MASAPSFGEMRASGVLRSEREYRQDIDGLRAVAVLPIVLFHAGVSRLSGGFIGVDIFFVISGYLITLIVVGEMEQGRFSLATFYRRRVVRIFPALFAMLAGVLAIGCAMMLPLELMELGRSAGATVGFVSNVYFFLEADYFAPAAETIPLLHTWSLGVEEQFYIFYPMLLLASRKFWPGRLHLVLVVVILGSLAWGAVAAWQWPQAGFYLLPSRAWELALGGLIAIGAIPAVADRRLRSLLSVAGAALVMTGYLVIRPEMGFPVPWALLPCVGCGLLIAYGRGAITEPLLSVAPMRFVGRISYSLYLWHWPIIAFYRLATGVTLDLVETLGLFGLSLLAAWLSWALVEQPVLGRFRKGPTRRILLAGVAGMAAMGSASATVSLYSDRMRDYSPEVERIAAFAGYRDSPAYLYQYRRGLCFHAEGDRQTWNPADCLPLSPTRANLVVLGNSHAAHLWRAFALRFPEANVLQATASGCRPTLDAPGEERCLRVVDFVLGPLLGTGRLDRIVLSARWRQDDLPRLKRTVEMIRSRGTAVLVLGPIIEYDGEFPSLLARAVAQHDPGSMVHHQIEDRRRLDRRMARTVAEAGGDYVSLIDLLCPGGRCRLLAPDRTPMHFDYSHLTLSGARWLVDRIAEQPLDPPLGARRTARVAVAS